MFQQSPCIAFVASDKLSFRSRREKTGFTIEYGSARPAELPSRLARILNFLCSKLRYR